MNPEKAGYDFTGWLPSGLAFSGSGNTAAISGTPEAGTAGTSSVSVTALTDTEGNVLLAAEIAITTEAEEFAAVVGEEFSTRVNVDVSLNIHSASYDKYAYLMEIFGLPEWLKADGPLESSGTLEDGQHYEFTLTGTPAASEDAQSLVFAATVMITGDTPEIEAYADKEVMLSVKAAAVSGDVPRDVSPDVTPVPVVIENGKITINADTTSGDSGGSVAEIITNLTTEEKQSITQLEINSEVQNLDWISELENLEQFTLNENALVQELDVSGNTAITELNTHGANVKALNVSGCTNLVSLDCSSGKIFALGEYFSASSFVSSASGAENVKNLKAFDASGSEIAAELDSVTGTASFSEEPSKITYDYDTGFSDVMMDVTVYFTGSSTEGGTEESGRVSSSSGGCNSAFGLLTISAGLILIFLKKR